MQWTSEPPTVEGWYWLAWGDEPPELHSVWLSDNIVGAPLVFGLANISVTDPADAWWYGPLVPPPMAEVVTLTQDDLAPKGPTP